ncbi:N-acetyltransferase [Burkholderia sp. WAC0059]|uniref:GNAT family N-acetyltransferase n=1 Tax=Burkholderia sp. WAC0059 TaxID=2066022 RepID=UPI000C7F5A22|nr:GNAT family N-acetyltransferase [Burkholderia sp. WAC0059]PLZ04165.1 N-acetyltransferase [Burkholderia sp. WAC0059]
MLPSIDELLDLDVLTLREHTERAGDTFDVDRHRASLQQSLAAGSTLCAVRRDGTLVAYAMLRPESQTCWFVSAFSTHPLHRTSAVFELLVQIAGLARAKGIAELRSHVYKTNRLSVSFHRKLGFQVVKENSKGVEFFAPVSALGNRPAVLRAAGRHGNRGFSA